MSKIKATRTLVYEGEEAWVEESLAKRWVRDNGISTYQGTIKETYFAKEKLISPAEKAWEQFSRSCWIKSDHLSQIKKTFLSGFEAAEKLQTTSTRGAV